jgi:hypothetical protein
MTTTAAARARIRPEGRRGLAHQPHAEWTKARTVPGTIWLLFFGRRDA